MSNILCVTNRALCREDFLVRVQRIAAAQPCGIVLREKDLTPLAYRALALRVLPLCAAEGVPLILSGAPRLAAELGCAVQLPFARCEGGADFSAHAAGDESARADGKDLSAHAADDENVRKACSISGQTAARREGGEKFSACAAGDESTLFARKAYSISGQTAARREGSEDFSTRAVFGVSVHSAAEAAALRGCGARYLVAGHIWDTACKAGTPGRGTDFLREICAAASAPVFAIGGVTPERLPEVLAAGARGACVMQALMVCENPAAYLREFEY